MKTFILSLFIFLSSTAFANGPKWENLSKSQQYDLLYDLEYLGEDALPQGTKVLNLTEEARSYPQFKTYMDLVTALFKNDVDREAIDQSPYEADGNEEVRDFYVLIDENNQILGAYVYLYQDGLDEDGNKGDINWSASARFDQNGAFFTDQEGNIFDELRFEWSGH